MAFGRRAEFSKTAKLSFDNWTRELSLDPSSRLSTNVLINYVFEVHTRHIGVQIVYRLALSIELGDGR